MRKITDALRTGNRSNDSTRSGFYHYLPAAIGLNDSIQPPAREGQQGQLTRDALEATAITMIPYP